jgi:hypothetical protein
MVRGVLVLIRLLGISTFIRTLIVALALRWTTAFVPVVRLVTWPTVTLLITSMTVRRRRFATGSGTGYVGVFGIRRRIRLMAGTRPVDLVICRLVLDPHIFHLLPIRFGPPITVDFERDNAAGGGDVSRGRDTRCRCRRSCQAFQLVDAANLELTALAAWSVCRGFDSRRRRAVPAVKFIASCHTHSKTRDLVQLLVVSSRICLPKMV